MVGLVFVGMDPLNSIENSIGFKNGAYSINLLSLVFIDAQIYYKIIAESRTKK